MLKIIKKDALLANEGVQLLELKNELRTKFNYILMNWMKDRDDKAVLENFISWLSLSGPEIFMASKINEESGNMLNNPRSTYIALLRELAAVTKKGTGFNNVLIPDRCIECHDVMQVIVREYMKSSNKMVEVDDASNVKNYKELLQDKNNVIGGEEEKLYMESIPDDIKLMFREIRFAKWSKDWIPVLILSPYDVELSLREIWKEKYDIFKRKNSVMEHIVYWYGNSNRKDMYGFVKNFISYEDVKKKGYHQPALKIKLKLANGKKLTKVEHTINLAFEEVEASLMVSKADRWDTKSLSLKGKSNTFYDAEDSLEEEEVVRLKRNERKMENDKIPDIGEFEAEYSEEDYASDVASYEHVEPKLRLNNDKILLHQTEIVKPSNVMNEEEKSSTKESTVVVKETFYGKMIDISLSIPERKKELSIEKSIANEEEEFYQNEAVIQPLMEKLNVAVMKNNSEEASIKLSDILKVLPTISPSFIELNGIGKLLISTRKNFDEDENIRNKVKAISSSMKEIYKTKIARRPVSFKRTWGKKCEENPISQKMLKMNDVIIAASTPVKLVDRKFVLPDARKLQNLCVIANIDPRKHGIATEMFPSREGVINGKNSAIIKPKKAKFSLRAMIDSSKQISVPSTGILSVVKENIGSLVASPVVTIKKKGLPKWLIDSVPSNVTDATVGDEVRSLGKEFIEALNAEWPDEVLRQINYESFVCNIEKAVYEWSQNDQTVIGNDSDKACVKRLKYPENYWMKLRDIVSGLSGDGEFNKPKLVQWMLTGEFDTPMDLVKLPGVTFYQSMKNIL
jgi:hypothetical protein